ncbi:DUF7289 family protein [Halorientalis salina]|uniref:DUF7289 family protein n=1 Tax=Halorientalis salina TaxID=2932266 RepID=UPI0010AC408C|nr:hypothetical protein [Halorientalis salina]
MTGVDDFERPVSGRRSREDERALSDVIGFVLTFSVIVASVAIVSTFGMQALEDIRGNEQENNAQRAFQVMAENFKEIERGRAPRRSSELKLNEGSLTVVNDSAFQVGVGGTGFNRTIYPQRIQYEHDNTFIGYENGATLRGNIQSGGSAMQYRPELVCTDNRAIVSFIELETSFDRSLSGGTLRVTGDLQRSELIYPEKRTGKPNATSGDQVNVTVDSTFARGWRNYLEDRDNWERANSRKWSCTDVDQVYIRKTVIRVTFVR